MHVISDISHVYTYSVYILLGKNIIINEQTLDRILGPVLCFLVLLNNSWTTSFANRNVLQYFKYCTVFLE